MSLFKQHKLSLIVSLFGLILLGKVQAVEVYPVNHRASEIQTMKDSAKGPFHRIRWFCSDGTVLPPVAYACASHGGGRQHGEWSPETVTLRNAGYPIATVYAALSDDYFSQLTQQSDELAFLVLEKFLINVDDGWIFRNANNYRGALQVESEFSRAEDLANYLVSQTDWPKQHYLLLREMIRLLASSQESDDFSEIRSLASEIALSYPEFVPIRNKIHNRPELQDVDRVIKFVSKQNSSEEIPNVNILIEKLRIAYEIPDWRNQLNKIVNKAPKNIQSSISDILKTDSETLLQQIHQLSSLTRLLRDNLTDFKSSKQKVAAIRLSLTLERTLFVLFSRLQPERGDSRQQRLTLINSSNSILYGMGLLSQRQLAALNEEMTMLMSPTINLQDYKNQLEYLAQTSNWAAANLHLHFDSAMQKMSQLEPVATYYYDDRLRTSVLIYTAQELDLLVADANRMSGLTHRFFDEKIGQGLRRLNPGLARGKLIMQTENHSPQKNEIILVPATTESLPPVAGILTEKEGNSLSHVQLLARNLGIPNAVVSSQLMGKLALHENKTVVLATSPSGVVHILADNPQWDQYFKKNNNDGAIKIIPDMKKLDLSYTKLTPLSELRATDSGRIVGPKAANLGQLKSLFPESVTEGVGLPFGLFKYYLDKPYLQTQQSTYQWMLHNYQRIKQLEQEPGAQDAAAKIFLAELRNRIENFELEPELIQEVKNHLESIGGVQDSGVFIRSDTNVEDLAGFTGAGLNLTLANVIGYDNIFNGIKKVWASPFSERAYAWRQSHMPSPEHVYTAVLLLRSVDVSASGVMVTTDLNNGDTGFLTIAVNEGIGGAVDNQASETLSVERATGKVTLLQQSSAAKRRQLSAAGGLKIIESSRSDTILDQFAIAQLIQLSNQLVQKYPQFVNEHGQLEPADIEFGFVGSKLVLFQIRPFLQNPIAQKNEYLVNMDSQLQNSKNVKVNLSEAPTYE